MTFPELLLSFQGAVDAAFSAGVADARDEDAERAEQVMAELSNAFRSELAGALEGTEEPEPGASIGEIDCPRCGLHLEIHGHDPADKPMSADMNKAGHTPGPWEVISPRRGLESRAMVGASIGADIYDAPLTVETAANARLIASAPDMLAALKTVLRSLPLDAVKARSIARAAILKAEEVLGS